MLDDPRINFAISACGHALGVNHFGFQVEDAAQLRALKQRAIAAAGDAVLDQGETACCYAISGKHWTIDPAGLAWGHFHTMSEIQAFGLDTASCSNACCIPAANPGGCCN